MAICKDCISHDICEKHKRLMLTVDNNFELIYQNGVQVSCRNFKDKSQYVEVVRCKDCKHRDKGGLCQAEGQKLTIAKDNHFCSKGERWPENESV